MAGDVGMWAHSSVGLLALESGILQAARVWHLLLSRTYTMYNSGSRGRELQRPRVRTRCV